MSVSGRKEKFILFGERDRGAEIGHAFVMALRLVFPPVMVEGPAIDGQAEIAERMPVAVSDLQPVTEFDSEFESGLGFPDKVDGINFQQLEKFEDRRDGRFADADGGNGRGFDQRDFGVVAGKDTSQQTGCGPTGCAASDDRDFPDMLRFAHDRFPHSQRPDRHLATVRPIYKRA
nr:hypothetical protein [Sphingopyxis sp. BSNA05]